MLKRFFISWHISKALAFAVFVFCAPMLLLAEKTAHPLESSLNKATSDTAKARIMGKIAWDLKSSNTSEAMVWANKELEIALREKDDLLLADAYKVKALVCVFNKQNLEAITLYDSCLYYAKRANSIYYQATCYSLLGGFYGDLGELDKSILMYQQGYDLALKLGSNKLISSMSNNLASAYSSANRNIDLVKYYYKQATEFSRKENNWSSAALAAGNLALVYSLEGERDSAILQMNLSKNFLEKDPENAYITATVNTIFSQMYIDLKSYALAIPPAKLAIAIFDSLKLPNNVLNPISTLAQVYVELNDIEKASVIAHNLLNKSLILGAKVQIRKGYELLSAIEKRRGNYKNALVYYEKYKLYNDSIFELNKEQNISSMEITNQLNKKALEIKYESEKKSIENRNLFLQNEDLKKEKIWGFTVSIVFAILLAYMFLLMRRRNKLHQELISEKKIVEQQVEEKLLLIQEVHHRVKNNLTILKSLLYLQSKTAKHDETKAALEDFQNRIQSIAIVHNKLYDDSRQGLLDFNSFLNTMFDEAQISFRNKQKDIQLEVIGHCQPMSVSLAIPLGLIINELMTNSFKYAFDTVEKGLIRVEIEEVNLELKITYADNGKGLPEGTTLSQGGFGFKVIQILGKQIGAHISYDASTFAQFCIQLKR